MRVPYIGAHVFYQDRVLGLLPAVITETHGVRPGVSLTVFYPRSAPTVFQDVQPGETQGTWRWPVSSPPHETWMHENLNRAVEGQESTHAREMVRRSQLTVDAIPLRMPTGECVTIAAIAFIERDAPVGLYQVHGAPTELLDLDVFTMKATSKKYKKFARVMPTAEKVRCRRLATMHGHNPWLVDMVPRGAAEHIWREDGNLVVYTYEPIE